MRVRADPRAARLPHPLSRVDTCPARPAAQACATEFLERCDMDTLAANMPVSTTYSYAIGPPEWINEHQRDALSALCRNQKKRAEDVLLQKGSRTTW